MAVDPDWVIDLFASFGPVRLRRMFSGYGVYAGDHCIALAVAPGIFLRADEASYERYREAGSKPFVYAKKDKQVTVQAWWHLPEAALDDPDALVDWARLSLDIARRLPPKKPRKAKARVKTAGKAAKPSKSTKARSAV